MRQTPIDYAAYVAAGALGLAGAYYGLSKGLTIMLAAAAGGAILGGRWLWRKWSKSEHALSLVGAPSTPSVDTKPKLADPNAQEPSVRRAHYFVAALTLFGVTVITLSTLLDNTTEVTPDHSEAVMGGALGVALFAAIASFALTIRVRLRPGLSRWLSSLMLSIAAAFFCLITAMFVIGRTFQYFDFPESEIVQSVAYLPIARAYRTGSATNDFHIQLDGPFADLDLDQSDYEAAFNGAKDVDPVGFCLRATIQRAGEAMRIMHSSAKPFPSGSVVKCPF